MARPQGTCTIAAANNILSGIATIDRVEVDAGDGCMVEVYRATFRNGMTTSDKNNTRLVAKVIDYAIENKLTRSLES